MLKIAVCSLFRDSQSWHGHLIAQVPTFFNQLEKQEGCELEFFLLEGNSQDNTYDVLQAFQRSKQYKIHLLKHDVANSQVASIVCDNRFKNLSMIGNRVLAEASQSDAQYIFWIESDFLIHDGQLIQKLAEKMDADTFCVCPVPMLANQFYDTWAFEGLTGERWGNHDLAALKDYVATHDLNSAGSCMLMERDKVAKHQMNFGEGCFPALCRQARQLGYRIRCHPELVVRHPSRIFVANRYV